MIINLTAVLSLLAILLFTTLVMQRKYILRRNNLISRKEWEEAFTWWFISFVSVVAFIIIIMNS
mgnify:CR=1 FL=1